MRRAFSVFAFLAFCFALHPATVVAQPATLWRDWAPGTEAIAGYPPSFVTLGDRAWFTQWRPQITWPGSANPRGFSMDIWTTDGTPAGTSLLKETHLGYGSRNRLDGAVALGSQIYFNVSFSTGLYVTRNTPDSTQLVFQGNDQCPEGNDETVCGWGLWLLATARRHLLFVPYHMDTGGWANGVPGEYLHGTFPLYSLDPGTGIATQIASLDRPSSALSLNGIAYYLDDASLVVTDGTAAGTSMIPLNDTACFTGSPYNADGFAGEFKAGKLIVAGGAVYAVRGCGNVWRVDSASSVSLVGSVNGSVLGVIGSRILLSCSGNCGMAVLDVGTGQESTIATGAPAPLGSEGDVWQTAGHLFFTEASSSGPGSLWSTDGTPAGTQEVLQLPATVYPPPGLPTVWASETDLAPPTLVATALGDELYFGWNGDLWSSDGTLGGTVDRVPVTPGLVLGVAALPGRNGVAISSQAPTGIQVSFYDAGAQQLSVLEQSPLTGIPSSYYPGQWLAAAGPNLLYGTYSNQGATQQLLSINGFSATVLNSGPYDVLPTWRKIGSDGSRVYLTLVKSTGSSLWASDGTVAGTQPISNVCAGQAVMDGGALYFVSGTDVMRLPPESNTPEVVGGYVKGTSLSVDSGRVFLTGPFPGSQFPSYHPNVLELTPTGTFLIGMAGRSTDAHVMVLGDLLFVTATDDEGWSPPVPGAIQAFTGGASAGLTGPSSWPGLVSNTGDPVLLKVSKTRALAWTDSALTVIDVSGADVTATPVPGLAFVSPELEVVGNDAYFVAADAAHGAELYRLASDSVVPELVADIAPGPEGSNPSHLYRVTSNGPLLFSAYDDAHGNELWMTAGTSSSTMLVQDLEPGPNGSDPEAIQCANGTLYFTAADDIHGRELWSMPISAVAPGVSACESAASSSPDADAGVSGPISPAADGGVDGGALDGGVDGGALDGGAIMSAGNRAPLVVRSSPGCAAVDADSIATILLGLLVIRRSRSGRGRRRARH